MTYAESHRTIQIDIDRPALEKLRKEGTVRIRYSGQADFVQIDYYEEDLGEEGDEDPDLRGIG